MTHRTFTIKEWYKDIEFDLKKKEYTTDLERIGYIRKQLSYVPDLKSDLDIFTPKWKIRDISNYEKALMKHRKELETKIYGINRRK